MKTLKLIFFFFVTFYLGQFAISLVLNSLLLSSEFRYSKVYNVEQALNYDILCIGNSRGVNSFYSPAIKQHGVKAFNLSYNGISAGEIEIILNDYLDTHKKPNKIFIELSTIFNNNPSETYNNFLLYSNFSSRFKSLIKKNDFNTYLIAKFFPIFKFNSEVFYRALYYYNKSDQDWVNRYKISNNLIATTQNLEEFKLSLNSKELKKIKTLNEALIKKNIKVYFFVAPYLPSYKKKIINFKQLKKEITLELGTEFHDLSNLLTSNRYFADRVHTNKEGAIKITSKLVSISD